jgi:hypothetical protein
MRRRPEFHPFDERLNGEKLRIKAALKNTKPGSERDLLERKLRQIETALHINGWVSSKELQPPNRTVG